MQRICWRCESVVAADARYCESCGVDLGAAALRVGEDVSIVAVLAAGIVAAAASIALISAAGSLLATIDRREQFQGLSLTWEMWVSAVMYTVGAVLTITTWAVSGLVLLRREAHAEAGVLALGAGLLVAAVAVTIGFHT